MPPKFIFVRHGEAKHNVAYHATDEKAFEDEANRDAPLTEKGRQQAKETAEKLSKYSIIDLWASPLTRCIETAIEIFEETSAQTCYLHDNLLERLGGNHVCNERQPKKSIKTKYMGWNTSFLAETPPYWIEREDWTSLHYRTRAMVLMLADIYKQYPETSYIVIVSHKDAISSITKRALTHAEPIVMSLQEVLEVNSKIE
jgi:broad specificity phosphatase PhoE